MTRLPTGARRWLAAYVLVAVVAIVAEATDSERVSTVGLVLAVPVLVGVTLTAGLRGRRTGRWLLVGLGLSWLGDTFGWLILVKIGFFLLAQIAYVVAFWPYRRQIVRHPAIRPLYVAAIVVLAVIVGRQSGALLAPVVGYGFAVALMAVLATGVHRLAAVGGVAFVVSDAVLGIDTFVPTLTVPTAGVVIMVTYLTAQLLLVLGVVSAGEPRSFAPASGQQSPQYRRAAGVQRRRRRVR